MSLHFDPDFVAEKVVLLESDLQKLGQTFISNTGKIYDLNSQLSLRNAQLRS